METMNVFVGTANTPPVLLHCKNGADHHSGPCSSRYNGRDYTWTPE